MILLDFRNWEFTTQKKYLPNAQKELVQSDFNILSELQDFSILKTTIPVSLSDLFLKNENTIAVSSVKDIERFYETLDSVLEVEDKEVMDYTEAAEEEVYFYGSSSLVVNHKVELGICGVNENTDESLFEEYCEDFELNPFSFDLLKGVFTSDIALFVGNKLLMCLDYIKDKKLKKQLIGLLKNSGVELIAFTKEQVEQNAFNAKLLEDGRLVILQTAYNLFTEKQRAAISDIDLEIVALPFLEEANVKLRDILL
ncbi:arginine deiminase-related protein [Ochrovirga pacifica]|uniref:arginine deiminase-related protein n=1 Tax=Ochrovirga pacifica TaxID=1042376 RepID=UPI00025583EE|nr:arginine deiminase-related protein [Ochrovirga pacifica]